MLYCLSPFDMERPLGLKHAQVSGRNEDFAVKWFFNFFMKLFPPEMIGWCLVTTYETSYFDFDGDRSSTRAPSRIFRGYLRIWIFKNIKSFKVKDPIVRSFGRKWPKLRIFISQKCWVTWFPKSGGSWKRNDNNIIGQSSACLEESWMRQNFID